MSAAQASDAALLAEYLALCIRARSIEISPLPEVRPLVGALALSSAFEVLFEVPKPPSDPIPGEKLFVREFCAPDMVGGCIGPEESCVARFCVEAMATFPVGREFMSRKLPVWDVTAAGRRLGREASPLAGTEMFAAAADAALFLWTADASSANSSSSSSFSPSGAARCPTSTGVLERLADEALRRARSLSSTALEENAARSIFKENYFDKEVLTAQAFFHNGYRALRGVIDKERGNNVAFGLAMERVKTLATVFATAVHPMLCQRSAHISLEQALGPEHLDAYGASGVSRDDVVAFFSGPAGFRDWSSSPIIMDRAVLLWACRPESITMTMRDGQENQNKAFRMMDAFARFRLMDAATRMHLSSALNVAEIVRAADMKFVPSIGVGAGADDSWVKAVFSENLAPTFELQRRAIDKVAKDVYYAAVFMGRYVGHMFAANYFDTVQRELLRMRGDVVASYMSAGIHHDVMAWRVRHYVDLGGYADSIVGDLVPGDDALQVDWNAASDLARRHGAILSNAYAAQESSVSRENREMARTAATVYWNTMTATIASRQSNIETSKQRIKYVATSLGVYWGIQFLSRPIPENHPVREALQRQMAEENPWKNNAEMLGIGTGRMICEANLIPTFLRTVQGGGDDGITSFIRVCAKLSPKTAPRWRETGLTDPSHRLDPTVVLEILDAERDGLMDHFDEIDAKVAQRLRELRGLIVQHFVLVRDKRLAEFCVAHFKEARGQEAVSIEHLSGQATRDSVKKETGDFVNEVLGFFKTGAAGYSNTWCSRIEFCAGVVHKQVIPRLEHLSRFFMRMARDAVVAYNADMARFDEAIEAYMGYYPRRRMFYDRDFDRMVNLTKILDPVFHRHWDLIKEAQEPMQVILLNSRDAYFKLDTSSAGDALETAIARIVAKRGM